MKIFTLGKGFVSDHLPYEKILDRVHTHYEDLDRILSKQRPDVIVNCIGKTGRPNVDWCESHQVETYTANVILPALIADWCEAHSVHLIQLGSGCIYFGESPNIFWTHPNMGVTAPKTPEGLYFQNYYNSLNFKKVDTGWKETDSANPKSYYSKTKYACDLLLGDLPNVTTLRIRMPISSKNDPRNFINKIKGYSQIIDIPNSMTIMDDLVRCVEWAAKEGKTGIYHVANSEPITAAQVMREYQKYFPEHKFEVIDEATLDKLTIAKRSNCILDTLKLKSEGFHMTPSEEALKNCMTSYINNL